MTPQPSFGPATMQVVPPEPVWHGLQPVQCLQKDMETGQFWPVSMQWEPNDVSYRQLLPTWQSLTADCLSCTLQTMWQTHGCLGLALLHDAFDRRRRNNMPFFCCFCMHFNGHLYVVCRVSWVLVTTRQILFRWMAWIVSLNISILFTTSGHCGISRLRSHASGPRISAVWHHLQLPRTFGRTFRIINGCCWYLSSCLEYFNLFSSLLSVNLVSINRHPVSCTMYSCKRSVRITN